MIPDILDVTFHFVSYLYLLIINIRFLGGSKLWHIKRVSGYIFCTRKNGMSIVISSISCQVRWHQILPDVTLHLVSCVYILIINIRFSLSKLWHIKRVAGYLFYTRNNLMHFIISSIICHVRCFQISCFISSDTCTFWLSISYILFFEKKNRAYKTSS